MNMTYEEAINFIHSVEWQGSRPGLSRITELLNLIGNPQNCFKCVHVAGTNGKGSFCAMLESVLRSAGYKTGLFTSPYIEFFEERIRFNGEMIDKIELADIVSYIAEFTRQMSDVPTEFELLTAIGFEYFKRKNIDIAIIECGMGGRLDSTNVISSPLLSVITSISLDHTQFLGDTIDKIAFEKAGIIKPKSPVLYGGENPIAEEVIRAIAQKNNSEFFQKNNSLITDLEYDLSGTRFRYKNSDKFFIPLLGAYQPENAASVIEAVEILRERNVSISEAALKDGLSCTTWKGRFEILCKKPLIIFDGGHNEEGIEAAVRTVKQYFGNKRVIFVSGVLKDKDYFKIAKKISTVSETVFTASPNNPRALKAEEYSGTFNNLGVNSVTCDSYEHAVTRACILADKEGLPIICVGSLYSYSDIKKAVGNFSHNS